MLNQKVLGAKGVSVDPAAWDISYAVFVRTQGLLNTQNSQAIYFSDDGLNLYNICAFNRDVNQFSLSIPWNVSSLTYIRFFSVATEESTPTGLFFKPDGTKMYINGVSGNEVNQYNLSTAWDISTATFIQNFSVTNPTGSLFFRYDGLKMYIPNGITDVIVEYDLSIAWDISTASFAQNLSIAAQDALPKSLFFKPDGKKMYLVGFNGDNVNEYSLSIAWDISTASYVQNFSVAANENEPSGIFFKPDGLKMYITGNQLDDILEYDLQS